MVPMTYTVDNDAISRRNKGVIINQREKIIISLYLNALLLSFVRYGPFIRNKIFCIWFDFMSFCSLSFKYRKRCSIQTLVIYWRPTQYALFSLHYATSKHDLMGYTSVVEKLGNMSKISILWVSIPASHIYIHLTYVHVSQIVRSYTRKRSIICILKLQVAYMTCVKYFT